MRIAVVIVTDLCEKVNVDHDLHSFDKKYPLTRVWFIPKMVGMVCNVTSNVSECAKMQLTDGES